MIWLFLLQTFLTSGYSVCHPRSSWKCSFAVGFVSSPSVIQQCWSEGECRGVQVLWMLYVGSCVPRRALKSGVSGAEPGLAAIVQGQQK